MNSCKYVIIVFIALVFVCLNACSNYPGSHAQPEKIISEHMSTSSQQLNSIATDSMILEKDRLTNIYIQAIAEFIHTVYKKDKATFDTLYFGKHVYGQPDDFPDIDLPQTVENTQIRLVSPVVGQKKQMESKSLVYINLIGWVDKAKAEFLFVVFSNGAKHNSDYYINFINNTTTNKFELDKIEFENYTQLNVQKPKRITIFKDGKYVVTGDKELYRFRTD